MGRLFRAQFLTQESSNGILRRVITRTYSRLRIIYRRRWEGSAVRANDQQRGLTMQKHDISTFRQRRTSGKPLINPDRDRIQADIDAFLAKGGSVEVVPVGRGSDFYSTKTRTEKQNRDRFRKMTASQNKDL